jgi:hypothetical protein
VAVRPGLKKSLKVSRKRADAPSGSFAPAQRRVQYTVDLLSPAELQLLRRAVVVHEGAEEVETPIVAFELVELPD